jgi:hypothetical protein
MKELPYLRMHGELRELRSQLISDGTPLGEEAMTRPRIDDMDRWDPPNHEAVHTLPIQPTTLTSWPKRTIPTLDDGRSDRMQGRYIAKGCAPLDAPRF